MKLLNLSMILGILPLVSCVEEKTSSEPSANKDEIKRWQERAGEELARRQLAESATITAETRAQSMEQAALATGVAAVGFLILGGAVGSKTKKDALLQS